MHKLLSDDAKDKYTKTAALLSYKQIAKGVNSWRINCKAQQLLEIDTYIRGVCETPLALIA